MEQISGVPIIFTPGNEPYLGRELLRAFDELIVCCLEHNQTIASRTRIVANKTVLQEAVCILIPQGVSLALSIRELVRQVPAGSKGSHETAGRAICHHAVLA